MIKKNVLFVHIANFNRHNMTVLLRFLYKNITTIQYVQGLKRSYTTVSPTYAVSFRIITQVQEKEIVYIRKEMTT